MRGSPAWVSVTVSVPGPASTTCPGLLEEQTPLVAILALPMKVTILGAVSAAVGPLPPPPQAESESMNTAAEN